MLCWLVIREKSKNDENQINIFYAGSEIYIGFMNQFDAESVLLHVSKHTVCDIETIDTWDTPFMAK